jgi:hypothetical protein
MSEMDLYLKEMATSSISYMGADLKRQYPTLKEYCKAHGYSFRQRRRGDRYYVTIADKSEVVSRDWQAMYTKVVELYHPKAYMTSGSITGATFMIGDIMSLLRGG